MLITVDEAASEPLYRQIAGQLRRAIADGSVGVGDRLPPARDLAASLAVNMHTVRHAYQALHAEGLVEMRRGRGVSVVSSAVDRADLGLTAHDLVTRARRLGLSDTDIVRLVEVHL
jgi:GntR family transcriptional regulator